MNPTTAVIRTLLTAQNKLRAKGWCQGADAVDRNGLPVGVCYRHAVRWSVLGAVASVSPNSRTTSKCLTRMREASGSEYVVSWNDARGRTLEQVLAMLDAAIALERKAAKAQGRQEELALCQE